MEALLGTLGTTKTLCIAIAEEKEEKEENEENKEGTEAMDNLSTRTLALLVRSVLASIAKVVSALPRYFHPYMERTLSACLGMEAAEHAALSSEVDRCLSAVALSVPARLAVPRLTKAVPVQLQVSHSTALRTVRFLGHTWGQLDRSDIIEHTADVELVCAYLLDYRRALGGQGSKLETSQSAALVEQAASDAIVGLCLKLTESELRKTLARFAEWRDSKDVLEEEEEVEEEEEAPLVPFGHCARNVSFYRLLESLGNKLQSLFTPSIVPFWQHSADTLAAADAVKANVAKLRKQMASCGFALASTNGDDSSADEDGGDSDSDVREARELLEVIRAILTSVRIACIHDSGGLIDEDRYEAMMPVASGVTAGSAADAAYLKFVTDYVAPCLSSLALCVGKDTLWKPLTHKVLMNMRERASVVRLAALKTLHKLFVDVGDEFLILLPECLPFLSELLEDNSADVVDLTNTTIRYIEELSGEKLDDYLK
eukprot:GSChrysophyteH2.ASY1.ANO1.383.1 assembled CDS